MQNAQTKHCPRGGICCPITQSCALSRFPILFYFEQGLAGVILGIRVHIHIVLPTVARHPRRWRRRPLSADLQVGLFWLLVIDVVALAGSGANPPEGIVVTVGPGFATILLLRPYAHSASRLIGTRLERPPSIAEQHRCASAGWRAAHGSCGAGAPLAKP